MKFADRLNKKFLGRISYLYVFITLVFIVWMLFFDTNSYFIQKELKQELNSLESNIEFYNNEIRKDSQFIKEMNDIKKIEKYAREKYYMKKENEEIFIIE